MRNLLDRQVNSAFYGKFSTLRPVQDAAIAPLLNGQNTVLCAGTGSGKTEAAMAPLISRYWQQAIYDDTLAILYIAPTKALVNDIENRLYSPLQSLGMRVGIRHGDRDDLTKRLLPHVLVTTPESLDVLIFRKDRALQGIKAIVIDEVHLLYNTQRGLQLSILLQRLKQFLDRSLQWAALSATVGNLENVRNFLFGNNEPAEMIAFSGHREINAHIRHITTEIEFADLITRLIEDSPFKLLVFANSRRECERLVSVLQQQERLSYKVFAHYSSLSSDVRVNTETMFAAAQSAICITTSTLELGIDIGDIEAVILWDVPSSIESFLQRIGRSNRREAKTNVICLIPDTATHPVYQGLKFLALLDAARNGEIPARKPHELYGAVGQQCLSAIASNNGSFTRIRDLHSLFSHLNHLTRDKLESILSELAINDYLQPHGYKNQYGANDRLWNLVDYRLIYGNFGLGSQSIKIINQSEILGEVPIDNLLRISRGDIVRFAGRSWSIVNTSREAIKVEPEPNSRRPTVSFIYGGKGIGDDVFICDRVAQILSEEEIDLKICHHSIRSMIQSLQEKLQDLDSNNILFCHTSTGFLYYTFAGKSVNKAIAVSQSLHNSRVTDIVIEVPYKIQWQNIPSEPIDYLEIIDQLFDTTGQSIYQALLPTSLQREELIQNWITDPVIAKVIKRLKMSTPVEILFDISELST